MIAERNARFWADARHAQILALGALLTLQFTRIDFGATPANVVCALAGALGAQALPAVLARLEPHRWPFFPPGRPSKTRAVSGLPGFDLRSALISALSLALLLRASSPLWLGVAGVLAIGSKFLLRVDGRHIFNPSAFAIVALLGSGAGVWVSPGQWGAELWFAGLILVGGALVLTRARRADIALQFLGCHFALLLTRAYWLGDPLAIPLHQIQSGSLLIFAAFMITDPRTTPKTSAGRFALAFCVAALAHYLAFYAQMRPALYVALIALNPLVPLIDRLIAAARGSRGVARLQGAPV